MGHAIDYLYFDENKTSKQEIEKRANDIAKTEGDYHSGLNSNIRWLNHICENLDEAYEYVKQYDKGWYDQLAVKYYEYPKIEPNKKILTLQERIKKEKEKRDNYEKLHAISSFKIDYIGCPNCGSKLKRILIRGNWCPLCNTELRSKTTMDTLKRYNDNIQNLLSQIKEEEKKINQKNIKNAKVKWLVKIEYHI